VLDFLNIQIENPCVVLDQENSKTFLKGSPHDKYKFFLRATGLCQYYLLTYNYLSMLIIVMLLFHSTISHYCSCAYSTTATALSSTAITVFAVGTTYTALCSCNNIITANAVLNQALRNLQLVMVW
jgi:hypothetical protein